MKDYMNTGNAMGGHTLKPNPPNGYMSEFEDMQRSMRELLATRREELDAARTSVRALEGMVTALECAINTFSDKPPSYVVASKYPG